jgi:Tol biopolymer transport system component
VRAACLLALAGCGFQHGSLGPGGGDDAAAGDDAQGVSDAAATIDAPPEAACLAKWRAGPTLSTPVMVGGVNTTGDEGDPFLTADEKTIYFVRSADIYKGTRTSLSNGFSNVAKASDLSSGANDTKVSLTADGLTAFLNSARTGTGGATDIFHAQRGSATATFTTIDQAYLGNVNTNVDQWDPHISANGLRLYYAPSASPAQHIVFASRATTSDEFGALQVLDTLDSGEVDNDPTLTADERLIVWASNRNGDRNLWYAWRDDPTQPFGTPIEVPDINTNTDDGGHLSADGCRLYFVSNRDVDDDIWITTVQ